ncbi:MAG: aminopeptidase P family protein [Gemmatimonadota bacterium]|nr:aminopeptidase P family protein [Gemmatimonadota bacterium]
MAPDRRDARRAALLASMEECAIDGLIITHLPNIRYLTGFSGTSGVMALLRQESVLCSDFRYRTQAHEEVGDVARIEIAPNDLWERLFTVLGEYAGIGAMGFESHVLTNEQRLRMERQAPQIRLAPVVGLVERHREQKDPDEIAAVRAAAVLAGDALEAVLPTVSVGQRESDVAARLELELRARGSEWHPFPTIVASGPRTALPHARTSQRPISKGEWLLLDFGAQVGGYCADVTRTVVVGATADEQQRTIYDLVREAQLGAREHIRSGMTGREADALAREIIHARGFGDAFGHSLGHGLGLEVHEGPRLSRVNDKPLPLNAVVTIEPGIYLEGWGGVRIEDDVHLSTDGAVVLSDGRAELKELT